MAWSRGKILLISLGVIGVGIISLFILNHVTRKEFIITDEGVAHQKLNRICIAVIYHTMTLASSEDFSEKDPMVTTVPELADWLEEKGEKYLDNVDYEKKTIQDPWGNEIVVLSKDGIFTGVGSAGPNGKWEQGYNDDIEVTLEKLRRILREDNPS